MASWVEAGKESIGGARLPHVDTEVGEACHECGERYGVVYRLPDDLWRRIYGSDDGSGLLCPNCAHEKARRCGITLYWEAAENRFPSADTDPRKDGAK